jgi:hypothetical protein
MPCVRSHSPGSDTCPNCRARGAHAHLVRINGVNASPRLPQVASGSCLLLGVGSGPPTPLRCHRSSRRHVSRAPPVTIRVLVMLDLYFVSVKYVCVCVKLLKI